MLSIEMINRGDAVDHAHRLPSYSCLVSSFMQAMNEYRGGKMSTEVVVDRNLKTEIVDRRRKCKYPASVAPW